MDIVAHGLWAAAAAKAVNLKVNSAAVSDTTKPASPPASPPSNRGEPAPPSSDPSRLGRSEADRGERQGGRDVPRHSAVLNLWLSAFWGVFPDLFAFTIPFTWLILGPLFGDQVPRLGPPDSGEPPPTNSHWTFHLASILYNYSHSIVIFFVVIGLMWLIRRRIPWVMGGWLLHILIDIPTHSYKFYPTPFLWPLSSYKFDGISWGTPWFMIVNYSSLALVYLLLLFVARKRKQPPSQPSSSKPAF